MTTPTQEQVTPILNPDDLAAGVQLGLRPHAYSIKGKVVRSSSKEYGGYCYGEFQGPEHQMTFMVPAAMRPREGETIVVHGFVHHQVKKDHLVLVIKGTVVGGRSEVATAEHGQVEPTRSRHPVSLRGFLETSTPRGLLVLGTPVAHQDIARVLSKMSTIPTPTYREVNTTDREEILSILHAEKDNFKGVVFTQGGIGSSISPLWSDGEFIQQVLDVELPVFTALGHATTITPLDRLADESFPMPGGFAGAIVEHYEAQKARIDAKKRLDELQAQHQQLTREKLALEQENQTLKMQKTTRSRGGLGTVLPWLLSGLLLVLVAFK